MPAQIIPLPTAAAVPPPRPHRNQGRYGGNVIPTRELRRRRGALRTAALEPEPAPVTPATAEEIERQHKVYAEMFKSTLDWYIETEVERRLKLMGVQP